mgnify:CR=1 FL=1
MLSVGQRAQAIARRLLNRRYLHVFVRGGRAFLDFRVDEHKVRRTRPAPPATCRPTRKGTVPSPTLSTSMPRET